MSVSLISVIYPEKAKLIKEGKCPICEQPAHIEDMRDAGSMREFRISGMCQKCQDETFG